MDARWRWCTGPGMTIVGSDMRCAAVEKWGCDAEYLVAVGTMVLYVRILPRLDFQHASNSADMNNGWICNWNDS